MGEIPDDIMAAAIKLRDILAREADWDAVPKHIANAIMAARPADKPATTVYGNLLWRHMDACRKSGVPSEEQAKLFRLIEEFRAVYPEECKVWEDRYPGD